MGERGGPGRGWRRCSGGGNRRRTSSGGASARRSSASALRFLRNAERLGLASPAVLNDLALALARVGQRDEARETIRRARTADPGNEHIRATEAEIGAK